MNFIIKKTGKMMLVILLSLTGVLLAGFLIVLVNSPGKLTPLKDEHGSVIQGSISEKVFIEVNGIRQGMFIRGENPQNPVILYLHGGPGSPELPIIYPYEKSERLEKYFTVCYWDQRGAGMSFSNSIDISTMTMSQMIEDVREVTDYLKQRFNQKKIYLLGHSWGSFLGIKTIEKYPENYLAYIGIGQLTNQVESEKMAYDYMLQHAKEIGDNSAVKKLEKFDKNAADFPTIKYVSTIRSSLMNKYGIGIMHENVSMAKVVKNILFFEGYTLSEKLNYIQGMLFSQTNLWNYVIEDDLFVSSTSLQVPVYITHGKYDYQVSHTLAYEYFERIEAPKKEFFTFELSAHSPNMEEPEKFIQIFRKIALENSREKK